MQAGVLINSNQITRLKIYEMSDNWKTYGALYRTENKEHPK